MKTGTGSNGFDKLARPYRWLEYVSFGPLLQQTRTSFLPQLLRSKDALVVGDGDGRFTASLLRANPHVRVLAVDGSAQMLKELSRRAKPFTDRVSTVQLDARRDEFSQQRDLSVAGSQGTFDLVCTHFFLDCLDDRECKNFAREVSTMLRPGACWIVSEFAVPTGAMRRPAAMLVRALYAAFGLLTGLRARRLPDYTSALRVAGLQIVAQRTRLFGILRAEMWRVTRVADSYVLGQTASQAPASNQT